MTLQAHVSIKTHTYILNGFCLLSVDKVREKTCYMRRLHS